MAHVGTAPRIRKTVLWGIVAAVAVVAILWLFGDRLAGDPTATEIRGLHRIIVTLSGPNRWVDVSDRLPGCTRVVFRSHRAREPYVRLGRGAPQPLGSGREFGRLAYPIEVSGSGDIIMELHDIGRRCI